MAVGRKEIDVATYGRDELDGSAGSGALTRA